MLQFSSESAPSIEPDIAPGFGGSAEIFSKYLAPSTSFSSIPETLFITNAQYISRRKYFVKLFLGGLLRNSVSGGDDVRNTVGNGACGGTNPSEGSAKNG
jgi:hypothetical protein